MSNNDNGNCCYNNKNNKNMSDFEYKDEECNEVMNEMKEITSEITSEIKIASKTPHYHRLTFISMNACDFCTHVTKPGPYMHYLSFETKNGWVSCGDESCKKRGKQAVEAFMENKAYGRANHLKDRTAINVKRTSGQMDDDWLLERMYPEVQIDNKGEEKVCVTKPSALIEKWVSIDNLLSWNSS